LLPQENTARLALRGGKRPHYATAVARSSVAVGSSGAVTAFRRVALAATVIGSTGAGATQRLRDALFAATESGDSQALPRLCAEARDRHLPLDDVALRQPVTGETALHRALLCGRDDAARLLVAEGGSALVAAPMAVAVGDGGETEVTCLHLACERCSLATVRCLVEAAGDADRRAALLRRDTLVLPKGQRARHLNCLHIAAKSGRADVTRYLVVECGLDANMKNSKNATPLLWAANDGRADVVELLIGLGARVDEQNDKGSSALHWAVRGRHLAVAQALLEKGKANPNIRRKQGLVCPLAMAAAMGYDDVVQLLVRHGADVRATVHDGEQALHYAAGEGAADVCETLLDAGERKAHNCWLEARRLLRTTISSARLLACPSSNVCCAFPQHCGRQSSRSQLLLFLPRPLSAQYQLPTCSVL